jgi:hypothetical protein
LQKCWAGRAAIALLPTLSGPALITCKLSIRDELKPQAAKLGAPIARRLVLPELVPLHGPFLLEVIKRPAALRERMPDKLMANECKRWNFLRDVIGILQD